MLQLSEFEEDMVEKLPKLFIIEVGCFFEPKKLILIGG
jgi:hypothetical protein